MRIYTKSVLLWDDSRQRYVTDEAESEWYEYSGPVALCKGDSTAKAAEQQQASFNAQLMSIFQQQFGKQSAIMDYLKGKMQPIIDAGGTGYSDDALAAMRASATDTLSNEYQNAQKALQTKEFADGGRDLPSGTSAQLDEALFNAEASDKAAAGNNITLANENLKQQNYWNAINVLSGVGAQFNPLGYASAATAGGNTVANLSQAYTASNQSQLLGALGGLPSIDK